MSPDPRYFELAREHGFVLTKLDLSTTRWEKFRRIFLKTVQPTLKKAPNTIFYTNDPTSNFWFTRLAYDGTDRCVFIKVKGRKRTTLTMIVECHECTDHDALSFTSFLNIKDHESICCVCMGSNISKAACCIQCTAKMCERCFLKLACVSMKNSPFFYCPVCRQQYDLSKQAPSPREAP